MSTRRANKFIRCQKCFLHPMRCVCPLLPSLHTSHRISLVVHVRELSLPTNTSRLLNLVLPDESKVWVRGRMNFPFNAKEVLSSSTFTPYYLFPDEDAKVMDENFFSELKSPIHLIVPDGSWSQARKFKQREPLFKPLPSLKLPSDVQKTYRLRKSIKGDWVSTYESVAYALRYLGEEKNCTDMLGFFEQYVQTVLDSRFYLPKSND